MLFECLRFQNVVYVACFLPFFFPVVSFSEGMLVFPVIMHIFINYWQNTLACMHCGVVNIYVQLDHESCLTAFKLKMEICRESTNTTEWVALCYRSFLSDLFFFLLIQGWLEWDSMSNTKATICLIQNLSGYVYWTLYYRFRILNLNSKL